MNKKIFLLLLLVSTCLVSQARPKPSWMTELPLPGNNTYIYVKETGQEKTPSAALNMALVHVFESTANRIGKSFDSEEAFGLLQEGTKYEELVSKYEVPINLVDQYTSKQKDGSYLVYVLCQVSSRKDVPPVWDRGKNIDMNYNWACLFRSIVPGVGQMSKGYTGEGIVTLTGEILLVGGAVGSYFLAQKQYEIINTTSFGDPSHIEAINTYNTLRNAQSFMWGAAGALYVFNFVRAFTLDPKSTKNLVFTPSMMSTPYTVSPTLGLTYKF